MEKQDISQAWDYRFLLIIIVVVMLLLIGIPNIQKIVKQFTNGSEDIKQAQGVFELESGGFSVSSDDALNNVVRADIHKISSGELNAEQAEAAGKFGGVEYFFAVQLYRKINGREELFTNDLLYKPIKVGFSASPGSYTLLWWDSIRWVPITVSVGSDGKYYGYAKGTGLFAVVK